MNPQSNGKNGHESRGAWFGEAKFAMFIHWGLYSHLGGRWREKTYHGVSEWIQARARIPAAEYAQTAREFNPVDFDPHEWVRLAKEAGMKYIVITSKHHDGFAMFKSQASSFNIVDATPFGRDPLKELAEACQTAGIRLGFYYSQTQDWHEPNAIGNTWEDFDGQKHFDQYLRSKAIPQIKEILTNYGPLALIWFDTPGPIQQEDSAKLASWVRQLQPECLINSRIGNGLGDYETLRDHEIPSCPHDGLWESVDTHNDSWGYAWYDWNWKGPREIVKRLIRVVSRGGNYMLNIGPDGRGRIPEASAQVLRKAGQWLRQNQEAIYGTRPSPLGPLPWGECTARGKTLYLHIFQWPSDRRLVVPGLRTEVKCAQMLNDDTHSNVDIEPHDGYAVLYLPASPPDSLVPIVRVEPIGELAPEAPSVVINNCRNPLSASMAEAVACHHHTLSWMEKFGEWKHVECLSRWEHIGRGALWEVTIFEPGAFYVEIEYSSPLSTDYSEWSFRLGEAEVTFPLVTSGHQMTRRGNMSGELPRFTTYRIGVFQVPQSGKYTISLAPSTPDAKDVHISSLWLIPAQR